MQQYYKKKKNKKEEKITITLKHIINSKHLQIVSSFNSSLSKDLKMLV